MVDIYKTVNGIFDESLKNIQDGLFESGAAMFDNTFFNIAFTLSVCYIAFLLMFHKLKSEESAYKLIWLICIFSIVKGILFNHSFYNLFIQIINAPGNALIQMIHNFVIGFNSDANIENIIENLITSLRNVHDTIYEKASWDNFMPYIYATLLYLCGTFLIVAMLLFSIFSIFLAKVVLSISPFVIIFLLWRKTEYIFFNWLRLYISLSLYPAMTMIFGLVSLHVAEHMKRVSTGLAEGGFDDVIGVCITLVLAALAIFKIPNIINQIIGSANEGSSLSSGMGTLSAGAAIVGTVAKVTGAKFAGQAGANLAHEKIDNTMNRGLDAIKSKWFSK